MTTKFIAYLRVSTVKQGQSGLGLEAQRDAVDRFVRGVGGSLLAEYVEIESGRKSDRPQLEQAFSQCRVHTATLIVAKIDRLSRNAHFLLGLKEAGVDFLCTDMPGANRLTIGIMAMVAEEEARLISARTKAALRAAKERGVRLGRPNLTPAAIAKGRRMAAEARRRRAEARLRDLRPMLDTIRSAGIVSYLGIARELTRLGVPTARGGTWTATQVRRMNP